MKIKKSDVIKAIVKIINQLSAKNSEQKDLGDEISFEVEGAAKPFSLRLGSNEKRQQLLFVLMLVDEIFPYAIEEDVLTSFFLNFRQKIINENLPKESDKPNVAKQHGTNKDSKDVKDQKENKKGLEEVRSQFTTIQNECSRLGLDPKPFEGLETKGLNKFQLKALVIFYPRIQPKDLHKLEQETNRPFTYIEFICLGHLLTFGDGLIKVESAIQLLQLFPPQDPRCAEYCWRNSLTASKDESLEKTLEAELKKLSELLGFSLSSDIQPDILSCLSSVVTRQPLVNAIESKESNSDLRKTRIVGLVTKMAAFIRDKEFVAWLSQKEFSNTFLTRQDKTLVTHEKNIMPSFTVGLLPLFTYPAVKKLMQLFTAIFVKTALPDFTLCKICCALKNVDFSKYVAEDFSRLSEDERRLIVFVYLVGIKKEPVDKTLAFVGQADALKIRCLYSRMVLVPEESEHVLHPFYDVLGAFDFVQANSYNDSLIDAYKNASPEQYQQVQKLFQEKKGRGEVTFRWIKDHREILNELLCTPPGLSTQNSSSSGPKLDSGETKEDRRVFQPG